MPHLKPQSSPYLVTHGNHMADYGLTRTINRSLRALDPVDLASLCFRLSTTCSKSVSPGASGAPVHELDGALGLDGGHCCVHVLWHHIASRISSEELALCSTTTSKQRQDLAKWPRYIMQQAMYLPWRGSHFTIIEAGSKTDLSRPHLHP